MTLSSSFAGGTSLVSVPSSYNDIKVHHIIVLYSTLYLVGSTQYSKSIIHKISEKIVQSLSSLTNIIQPLVYTGYIPDFLIRYGIRVRLREQLYDLSSSTKIDKTSSITTDASTDNYVLEPTTQVEIALYNKMKQVQYLRSMPIAIATAEANVQHYEVPTKFYDYCLGPYKKYSSGLWTSKTTTFEQSEINMLQLYCTRANVQDGMKIVDLGCGWGSLTLYICKHYPNCKITSISNSSTQREYIYKTATAQKLNVQNITVITCNVADDQGALDIVTDNDLVMTVEMLEHMKNYDTVFLKINKFLKPKVGQLFIHIFTHHTYCYNFDKGWMSDNFFTGGTMPSDDLLLYFVGGSSNNFNITNRWRVNGTHYSKTSNAWLSTLDSNWKNGNVQSILTETYGTGKEYEWYINWRLFFLACAELWGLDNGQEYIVSHYLFTKN